MSGGTRRRPSRHPAGGHGRPPTRWRSPGIRGRRPGSPAWPTPAGGRDRLRPERRPRHRPRWRPRRRRRSGSRRRTTGARPRSRRRHPRPTIVPAGGPDSSGGSVRALVAPAGGIHHQAMPGPGGRQVAGVVQTWSPISPPSTITSAAPAGSAARKNQVAKRRGASGGGNQWANGTSSVGSSSRPVSSWASRTAARRTPSNPSPSPASTRPPGNTHSPPNAWPLVLRSMRHSSPASPSRTRTTVAASATGASPVPVRTSLISGRMSGRGAGRAIRHAHRRQLVAVDQRVGDIGGVLTARPPADHPPAMPLPRVPDCLYDPRTSDPRLGYAQPPQATRADLNGRSGSIVREGGRAAGGAEDAGRCRRFMAPAAPGPERPGGEAAKSGSCSVGAPHRRRQDPPPCRKWSFVPPKDEKSRSRRALPSRRRGDACDRGGQAVELGVGGDVVDRRPYQRRELAAFAVEAGRRGWRDRDVDPLPPQPGPHLVGGDSLDGEGHDPTALPAQVVHLDRRDLGQPLPQRLGHGAHPLADGVEPP